MSEFKYDSNILVSAYANSLTFTKLPVGDINIIDDKHYYVYHPLEDITVFELSKIVHLMVIASTSSHNWAGFTNYDFIGFIRDNGIERHFIKKEK